MGIQLKYLMDKPRQTNGFTVLEALFVLVIATSLSYLFLRTPADSLSIFSRMIQMQCIQMQEKAFMNKQTTHVIFGRKGAYFDDLYFSYPKDIACDPISFQYNANGNISKGGHVQCIQGSKSIRFVFQIGAGRIRIEK